MKKRNCFLHTALVLAILSIVVCGLIVWGSGRLYGGFSVSPNGELLVITAPHNVTMYQLSNGKRVHQENGQPYGSQGNPGELSYIAWSPDSTNLAVGKPYNGVWIWDANTWNLLTVKDGERGERNEPSFAWSPNGEQLALGTGNGEIWVWNKSENKWRLKATASDFLISITWTKDGHLLKLENHKIYDVETGALLSELDHYIDGFGKVSWSPDGGHVYIFFDLGGGVMDVKENRYEFGVGTYPKIAWSKDGRYFASVQECDNEISVWDSVNHEIVKQERQGFAVYSLAWTPDNELLALGVRGAITAIWSADTGKIVKILLMPPNLICALY